MARTFSDITKVGAQSWRFQWSGTAPFRVYLEGRLLDTITPAEFTHEVSGATAEPPALEVLDATDTDDAANVAYPPRLILQWRGVSGAWRYLVQESVAAVWTLRARVAESAAGYYRFETDALADVTAHSWRIIAEDTHQNQSSALAFESFIVRNPPPPAVAMSYDAVDGEIDVTAA